MSPILSYLGDRLCYICGSNITSNLDFRHCFSARYSVVTDFIQFVSFEDPLTCVQKRWRSFDSVYIFNGHLN